VCLSARPSVRLSENSLHLYTASALRPHHCYISSYWTLPDWIKLSFCKNKLKLQKAKVIWRKPHRMRAMSVKSATGKNLSTFRTVIGTQNAIQHNLKVRTLVIAPVNRKSTSEALRYDTRCKKGFSQFYLHTRVYQYEPCLCLRSQLKLVLILPSPKGWKAEST